LQAVIITRPGCVSTKSKAVNPDELTNSGGGDHDSKALGTTDEINELSSRKLDCAADDRGENLGGTGERQGGEGRGNIVSQVELDLLLQGDNEEDEEDAAMRSVKLSSRLERDHLPSIGKDQLLLGPSQSNSLDLLDTLLNVGGRYLLADDVEIVLIGNHTSCLFLAMISLERVVRVRADCDILRELIARLESVELHLSRLHAVCDYVIVLCGCRCRCKVDGMERWRRGRERKSGEG
jgi:hypothetical protein